MVVRIKSPHSLQRAVNYNEKKVQQKKAECIHAGNYLKDADRMTIHEKMERMQQLMARNERTKKSNFLHISLNFSPGEKLSNHKLSTIGSTYMDKIGFGNQPYLVYVHHDAGHPHIHVVTTNIQPDGKRIDTYNLGKNQSEKARKEIEKEFGLSVAQARAKIKKDSISAVDIQRAVYGKSETKRSITNVLDAVLPHFKFTSLAELNAVLRQYNVLADPGKKDGVIHRHSGLLYRLLDTNGKNIGVPVKASSIYNKPTIKFLQQKFFENEKLRAPHKKKLKTSIDWIFSKGPKDLKALLDGLKKENVQAVVRQNNEGLVYGLTFIDYRTQSVFNGSDIGKLYSASAIQQRFDSHLSAAPEKVLPGSINKPLPQNSKKEPDNLHNRPANSDQENVLNELVNVEKNTNRIAAELLRKKRKKKNRNL